MRSPIPLAISIGLLIAGPAIAEPELPTPEELLAASIAHHDPDGAFPIRTIELQTHTVYSPELAKTRGREEAHGVISLSPGTGTFKYVIEAAGHVVEYSISDGESHTLLDGSPDISDEDRERLRIRSPELYRDYFEYVYGLPMKLRDPGTRLDPELRATDFAGREAWAMRVTYDPEGGEDIGYFSFDPETSALIGCRFFHDEMKNDGEYIVYDGEVVDAGSGLRLPASHAWYYNEGDGHLATDTITSLRVR